MITNRQNILSKIWTGSEHQCVFFFIVGVYVVNPLPENSKIPTLNWLEIKFCLRHHRIRIVGDENKKLWPIFGHFEFMETLNSTRKKMVVKTVIKMDEWVLSGRQPNPSERIWTTQILIFHCTASSEHFMRKNILTTIIMKLSTSLHPILKQQIQLDTMNIRSITCNTEYNWIFIASRK